MSEERMDYYASWPRWSVPKWVGVAMGGIFTLIIVVCAGMIVHLLRPPKRAPLPVVAAAPAQPKPAPTVPTSLPTPAPTPAIAPAPVAQPAPAVARTLKKHSAPAHKRSLLAKHESKSGRSAKSDLDRLLGL